MKQTFETQVQKYFLDRDNLWSSATRKAQSALNYNDSRATPSDVLGAIDETYYEQEVTEAKRQYESFIQRRNALEQHLLKIKKETNKGAKLIAEAFLLNQLEMEK